MAGAEAIRAAIVRAAGLAAICLAGGLCFGLIGCGGADEEPKDWTAEPVIPEISGQLKVSFLEDVVAADAAGMDPDVFAKVGDSNTELRRNLFGFGCSEVDYGEAADLKPVVERFRRVTFPADLAPPECQPANSFTRDSVAARSGTYSSFGGGVILGPPAPDSRVDRGCLTGETRVACEIRQIRPRYSIVMSGTNDVIFDREGVGADPGQTVALRLALVATRIRQAGSVPVFSTIPPIYVQVTPGVNEWREVREVNAAIYGAGEILEVPVINLYSALTEDQMIRYGLGPDGVHLSVFGGPSSPDMIRNSVNLTKDALRYGANRRNQVWVETLKALDEAVAPDS